MYAFATFAIVATVVCAWQTFGERQMQPVAASTAAQAQAQAANMASYRQSVIEYVQTADPYFIGSIPPGQLKKIANHASNGLWNNYVEGNTVVVYAQSPTSASLPDFTAKIAHGSVFAGVASRGYLVSSAQPGVMIPLPAGIANSIADGTPVWMAQVSRG
jgi:hypothetical protein